MTITTKSAERGVIYLFLPQEMANVTCGVIRVDMDVYYGMWIYVALEVIRVFAIFSDRTSEIHSSHTCITILPIQLI